MRAIFPFFQLPKASLNGALEVRPSSFIFLKAGLSFICSRMYSEISSRKIEPMKGMRQPQALKALTMVGLPSAIRTAAPFCIKGTSAKLLLT